MIDKNASYRPGLAAIAAVLALSSTPVMAQVALPADPAETIAPAAPAAVPAAPVQVAPVQTVQTVPATPSLPDIAVPEAAPKASNVATRNRTPERSGRSTRSVAARATAEPRTASPASTPEHMPVAIGPTAPVSHPIVTPAESVVPEQAEPAPVAISTSARTTPETDYAGWALLGGGLLLVAGGAVFALSRGSRRSPVRDGYGAADEDLFTVTPAPILPTAPMIARPVMGQPSHDRVPERDAAPVAATSVELRKVRPVAMNHDYAELAPSDRSAVLEAMVAEAPSEANPFRSRRNRLRRADFLLRTGQVTPRQGASGATEERELEPVGVRDRWSEMRFQGIQKTRISWKSARR
ncbi:MAG TPA: hypothetical protein VF503_25765 [Sphingobium sp.]|uniref:hypothetical protein n=1 Tax=Sphingobium sp. TaxID=1912891 RepID=UPI002ED2D027